MKSYGKEVDHRQTNPDPSETKASVDIPRTAPVRHRRAAGAILASLQLAA
jgi:hypothetical protein